MAQKNMEFSWRLLRNRSNKQNNKEGKSSVILLGKSIFKFSEKNKELGNKKKIYSNKKNDEVDQTILK